MAPLFDMYHEKYVQLFIYLICTTKKLPPPKKKTAPRHARLLAALQQRGHGCRENDEELASRGHTPDDPRPQVNSVPQGDLRHHGEHVLHAAGKKAAEEWYWNAPTATKQRRKNGRRLKKSTVIRY